MKIHFSALGLALLLVACVSTPETPSTSNLSEAESLSENVKKLSRAPSSEMKVLSDAYGDVRVYFCSGSVASVVIDPNRCGEARAKGNDACTEMPIYFSGPLRVVARGDTQELLTSNGKVAHGLKRVGAVFYLSGGYGNAKPYQLSLKTLKPQEIEELKYMKVCP